MPRTSRCKLGNFRKLICQNVEGWWFFLKKKKLITAIYDDHIQYSVMRYDFIFFFKKKKDMILSFIGKSIPSVQTIMPFLCADLNYGFFKTPLKIIFNEKTLKRKKEEKENTLKNSIRKIVTWLWYIHRRHRTEIEWKER